MKKVMVASAWVALYGAASLLMTFVLFGVRPATAPGWLIAAAFGVPVYVLFDIVLLLPFQGLGSSRDHPHSWAEIQSGVPQRESRQLVVQFLLRLALAAALISLLMLLASLTGKVVDVGWVTLQFTPMFGPE